MTMQHYAKETGTWSDSWLQGLPKEFTTDYGTLGC
jgi:hypothetical protein